MIPTKPPPSFRNPDKWSPEFIDFVSKCLVKNPEQRATAAELMQVWLKKLLNWSILYGVMEVSFGCFMGLKWKESSLIVASLNITWQMGLVCKKHCYKIWIHIHLAGITNYIYSF